MRTSEKEAIRWMHQSEDDFKFVQWVLSENVFFDKGCFVAQQAGEKALKACLYALGERRVFGHSLIELSNELSHRDGRFSVLVGEAKKLDRFYIPTRYPNGLPGGSPFQVFDRQDLKLALDALEQVMVVCRRFIAEKGLSY
jgi:HEPN domain-containing protein